MVEASFSLLGARRRVHGADGSRALAGFHGRNHEEAVVTAAMEAGARHVKRALAIAVRRLPWEYSCLVESLAAARMLRRRGISGSLVLGVRRRSDEPDGFEAHAWVEVGRTVVCGGASRALFTVLSIRSLANG